MTIGHLMQGVVVNLNAMQLSDLFFNYEHPEFDKIRETNVKNEDFDYFGPEARAALVVDAREFAMTLGLRGDDQEAMAVELAADMLARI